jgi:hypothetical protein
MHTCHLKQIMCSSYIQFIVKRATAAAKELIFGFVQDENIK